MSFNDNERIGGLRSSEEIKGLQGWFQPAPIALSLKSMSLNLQRSFLSADDQMEPAPKKQRTDAASDLNLTRRDEAPPCKKAESSPLTMLHRSCQKFSQDRFVVRTALELDPNAARRRASIGLHTGKLVDAALRDRFVLLPQPSKASSARKEGFAYPVNIALNNDASFEVLAMLVCVAPDVLVEQDGKSRLCSLSLALTKRPQDTRVFELILTVNPRAVVIPDRRHNLPLHVACQKGCPLSVILQLYGLHPDALHAQNIHGETPLMIAQRNSRCPENVVDFLLSR